MKCLMFEFVEVEGPHPASRLGEAEASLRRSQVGHLVSSIYALVELCEAWFCSARNGAGPAARYRKAGGRLTDRDATQALGADGKPDRSRSLRRTRMVA